MKKSIGAKTLVFPTPAWVVGTYDPQGRPNVMTAAWGGICCSVPPCVQVSLRKATYSHGNITLSKAFTVNVPSEKYIREVDYFGMVSGKSTDKFKVSGLTPVKSELVNAPYIQEFPLVLECRVIETVEIGLHTQFIGEIMDVKADEAVLNQNGLPDIEMVNPVIYSPENRAYHGVGRKLGQAFTLGREI